MHAHRVALVTGGGSGIGRAAAHAFAEHGCTIVVIDQNDAAGEETVQQIIGALRRLNYDRSIQLQSCMCFGLQLVPCHPHLVATA